MAGAGKTQVLAALALIALNNEKLARTIAAAGLAHRPDDGLYPDRHSRLGDDGRLAYGRRVGVRHVVRPRPRPAHRLCQGAGHVPAVMWAYLSTIMCVLVMSCGVMSLSPTARMSQKDTPTSESLSSRRWHGRPPPCRSLR